MKICGSCGAQIDDRYASCPMCGAVFIEARQYGQPQYGGDGGYDWGASQDEQKKKKVKLTIIIIVVVAFLVIAALVGFLVLGVGLFEKRKETTEKYLYESNLSTNVMDADTIRSATQTALSNPDVFDVISSGYDRQYTILTSADDRDDAFWSELWLILSNGREDEYKVKTMPGYEEYDKFAIYIDLSSNIVIVYMTDGYNYIELAPDCEID